MKQTVKKQVLSGLMAFVMLLVSITNVMNVTIFAVPEQAGVSKQLELSEPSIPSIRWSFESGALAPFKIVDGAFGVGLIANWVTERNEPYGKVNKDGNYYLSTVETDTTVSLNEEYVGTIVSPTFTIMDPAVTMKLGGGANENCYVAIVRESDGVELVNYHLSDIPTYEYDSDGDGVNDKVAASAYMFTDVTLTVPKELYSEGERVYLKIVDQATGDAGFIAVDDICAKGTVAKTKNKYQTISWSFEDGTIAPFTVRAGTTLNSAMITDIGYDWNTNVGDAVSGREIGKKGNFFLNTYFNSYTQTVADGKIVAKAGSGSEAYTGSLRSPNFTLNPANTNITMQLSGSGFNTVSVYDAATGTKLGTATSAFSSWVMTTRSVVWNEDFNYVEGQQLYMQIEDNLPSGWGFICVDNIRFSGSVVTYDYADAVWSFENNTILPFESEAIPGEGLVASFINGQTIPHGNYYLNTVLTSPTAFEYENGLQYELTSPEFMLDPENPVITLSVLGGDRNTGSYVAVCSAESGVELGRAYGDNSWTPVNRTIDLTGKFSTGERLVMKIVDGDGGAVAEWTWIGVDNIRARIALVVEDILTSREQVMSATGWDQQAFDTLITMVEDHMDNYTIVQYPNGQEYLDAIASMQVAQARLATMQVSRTSEECLAWIDDMEALAYEIYTTNPALGSGLIAFTVHEQYLTSHHNTHTMFPAYNGELDDKSWFVGGSSVKVLDLKTGNVYTLLEDPDGLYRDLDVSYNSDKILLSYRENKNSTYNIVEYTLSDDRTEIIATKQLTSLSTADDMDPMYMPSGDIVFSSTRDPKYVMCNRHISANLYRMEPDGANIVKITDSTLFERPTDVLPDGRILYDRWEYNDRDFGSAQGLWTVYEDGTKQDTYYGNNSPTGATIDGKAIPGTQKVLAVLSSCHDLPWGGLAIIDRSKGVDGSAPVLMTWPADIKNYIGDPNEDPNNIDAFVALSVKYEDPQPLNENYFLVSRTLPGSSKMGLYLVDTYGNEILLYQDDSSMGVFDATLLNVRETEIDTSDRRNYNDDVGTFFVQDVYQGTHMEGVDRGTVKTLRIVESVDKKFNTLNLEWNAEGAEYPAVNWHSFEVKRVIGEVPVYEDGSAYFEVPQDVFVYFQLLDKDGNMIQSMRSGTLVQSGEKTGCVGCHEDRRTAPSTTNGRSTPMALEANVKIIDNPDYVEGSNLPKTIIVNNPDVPQKRIFDPVTKTDKLVDYNDPEYFENYTDLPTMNFLTEVQPIFTNNCLTCHGYDNPEANLSLVPDKDVVFNAAYINLWVNRNKAGVYFGNLVGAIGAGDSGFYNAMSWGSYNSPLIDKIYNDETHMDLLTGAEKRKLAEWVDLNGTYYGDYSTNYGYTSGGRSPLTDAERAALGDDRGMSWGALQLSSFNKAIYFDNPEKSPILKGKTGAAYNQALAIIQTGLERLRMNPDVDWKGLTTVPGNTALSINPFRLSAIDQWRSDKVALYDAMEAANRAAIVSGKKLYDSDYEAIMAAHNAKWPGWPTASNPGHYYDQLPS